MESTSLPFDQVVEGNCIDVLAGFPAASVDVVFADPPYNLQLSQELWRPNLSAVDAVDDAWDQFSDFAEYDRFTRAWLTACRRVLKPEGTLWVIGSYHNIFRVGSILQDLDFWILNDVIWIKNNPMPNFRGVRLTNAHETLIWAQKERGNKYTFNHHALKMLNDDLQMRSDWYLPICTGKERLRLNGVKAHSTQKPASLLYRIMIASTNPGDVVLDPFFGTGTTGIAARLLQRHWIGIERNADYVTIARQRIAEIEQFPIEALNTTPNPRRIPRLPFGLLVETGLLTPGQTLYFTLKRTATAQVCADGALEMDGKRGSIHTMARALHPGPCNGWQMWFYEDPQSGQLKPVDELRKQLRG